MRTVRGALSKTKSLTAGLNIAIVFLLSKREPCGAASGSARRAKRQRIKNMLQKPAGSAQPPQTALSASPRPKGPRPRSRAEPTHKSTGTNATQFSPSEQPNAPIGGAALCANNLKHA
ncbi:hypothetical protein TRVL_08447 [Trypanosoma vivax]|nr:hypothetical protein TRVL_08447 [Trypanosoma vivax]